MLKIIKVSEGDIFKVILFIGRFLVLNINFVIVFKGN